MTFIVDFHALGIPVEVGNHFKSGDGSIIQMNPEMCKELKTAFGQAKVTLMRADSGEWQVTSVQPTPSF